MRERESLFNEYLLEVRKREKEEKVQKRDQVGLTFPLVVGDRYVVMDIFQMK